MGHITDEQIRLLTGFVDARVSEAEPFQNEQVRCLALAFRGVTTKQILAIRYYRSVRPDSVVASEIASNSWNLLVQIAHTWREHPEFPHDAAIETYDFDVDNPLLPTIR